MLSLTYNFLSNNKVNYYTLLLLFYFTLSDLYIIKIYMGNIGLNDNCLSMTNKFINFNSCELISGYNYTDYMYSIKSLD